MPAHAVRRYGPVQFVLRHFEIAADYYEHLGWQRVENEWLRPRP